MGVSYPVISSEIYHQWKSKKHATIITHRYYFYINISYPINVQICGHFA